MSGRSEPRGAKKRQQASFSSPYAVHNIDQIPTEVLRLLVILGPIIHVLKHCLKIALWQTDQPRQSVLFVLVWIMACLWIWQFIAFGLPFMLLFKYAWDWLHVRATRARHEALERKRSKWSSELSKKKQDSDKDSLEESESNSDEESDEEDEDDERMRLQRRQQRREEKEARNAYKRQPENTRWLDDTIQDLAELNNYVSAIQHQLQQAKACLGRARRHGSVSTCTLIFYFWPVWILMVGMLGTRGMFALVGSFLLLCQSPWVCVVSRVVRDNAVLSYAVATVWAYLVALVTSWRIIRWWSLIVSPWSWRRVRSWLSHVRRRARDEQARTLDIFKLGSVKSGYEMSSKQGKNHQELRQQQDLVFQIEVYEHQRWWLGIGWTTNLLPNERGPWTDRSLAPTPTKEDIELPEPTTTITEHIEPDGTSLLLTMTKTWQWTDPDWWIDMTGELQDQVDQNGWVYGNNAWKQMRGTPGMQTFTRQRHWCRRARLVEQRTKEKSALRQRNSVSHQD